MTTNRTSLFAAAAFLVAFTLSPMTSADEAGTMGAFLAGHATPPPAQRAERAAAQAETAAVAAVDAEAQARRAAELATAAPLAAADEGPKADKKIPLGKAGGSRRRSTSYLAVLKGRPLVVDENLPCVIKYKAEIIASGMSPEPDLYPGSVADDEQLIMFDAKTSNLGGTSKSECRPGTEPAFVPPTVEALLKEHDGQLVCAYYHQWAIMVARAKSRMSRNNPPMVSYLDKRTGSKIMVGAWGMIEGEVPQSNIGSSRCLPPLKSVNGKSSANPPVIQNILNTLPNWLIEKLTDLESRVHHLELRTPRIALGITAGLDALRLPNIPFGISLQFIWERYQGHMLIETGFQALAMHELLKFPKYKMGEWTLGGGWDLGLAYKWQNGVFFGGKLDFHYMQSVDVQGGLTSHGTATAFVGAGPWVGVITGGGHLILEAGLPLGCAWEMIELKKLDGSTAFPVVPGFGLVPTVKGTVRF